MATAAVTRIYLNRYERESKEHLFLSIINKPAMAMKRRAITAVMVI